MKKGVRSRYRKLSIESLSPRILLTGNSASLIDTLDFDGVALTADEFGAEYNEYVNAAQRNQGHMSPIALVPLSDVSHRAIASGDWTDVSTWQDGVLPTDGANVLIDSGVVVTVDTELSERFHTIRVDGMLRFATHANTELRVDTIVVAHEGAIEIGSESAPIDAAYRAHILFTDNGEIDTDWDPLLFSRGLVTLGAVRIHGAAKSGFEELAIGANAGDSVLRFETAPTGWRVGDRVLAPGVHRPLDSAQGETLFDQDEIAIIEAISSNGKLITLDRELEFDHRAPIAGVVLPVANLDRNIVFESENTTNPKRAGHVMFMHNANVRLHHASFLHMGRNDKSIPTTDPRLNSQGDLIPATGKNARARYAVHFHRTGATGMAAIVSGAVVENGPGWGFVNHDSNVIFTDNVTYNVKGAGFVSEVGSETGAFIHNLAVRSTGVPWQQTFGGSDKGEDLGFGSAGHGFWMHSPRVELINNIAAGHAQEGFFFHGKSIVEFGRDAPTPMDLANIPAGTQVLFGSGSDGEAVQGSALRIDQAPLATVRGNQVFASGTGIGVRWRRRPDQAPENGGDLIEDFKIWNVEWTGIKLGYVSGLTFRNGVVYGDLERPIELSAEEQANPFTETREGVTKQGKGIAGNRNSHNLRLEGITIAGFTVGIEALSNGDTIIDDVTLQNVENLRILTAQSTLTTDNSRRVFATNVKNVQLRIGSLGARQQTVRMVKQLDRSPVAGGSNPSHEFAAFTALDEIYYNGNRLYFSDQAADAVPFPSSGVPAFMSRPAYSRYLDLTNQELMDTFGVAFGGAIAPDDAREGARFGFNGLAERLLDAPTPEPLPAFWIGERLDLEWTLGDAADGFSWRTTGLAETTEWRIVLSGAQSEHELSRSGFPEEFANVAMVDAGLRPDDGSIEWEFDWENVGAFPNWIDESVPVGTYTIWACPDDGACGFLGFVTVESREGAASVSAPSDVRLAHRTGVEQTLSIAGHMGASLTTMTTSQSQTLFPKEHLPIPREAPTSDVLSEFFTTRNFRSRLAPADSELLATDRIQSNVSERFPGRIEFAELNTKFK